MAEPAEVPYRHLVPKQKRSFSVEIEARLQVLAFDEDSARKKIEKAFAAGRDIGTDVTTTDAIWTYAATSDDQ